MQRYFKGFSICKYEVSISFKDKLYFKTATATFYNLFLHVEIGRNES